MRHVIVAFAAIACLVGCAQQSRAATALMIDHRCVDDADQVIPTDALDRARRLKVLFGHQSVGFDVIHGLQSLAARPRYQVAVQPRIEPYWFTRNSGVGEFFLGRNGEGTGKVSEFSQKVRGGFGDKVDVAMMKLCYADIYPRINVDQVFAAQRASYDDLQRAYPKLKLVWWTCPVVRVTRFGDQRTRLNNLIREHVRTTGATLFDIADLECHAPDGRLITAEGCELLYEGYSRDQGGHLNEAGQQHMARAWWWLMARLSGWQPG